MTENPTTLPLVSRRTLVRAAWATPVIAAAVAAPHAAASAGIPSLSLNIFALDESYAWATVIFSRDGLADLTQAFDFQGAPPSEWESIYTGLSTNSSGYFASTVPRVVVGNYTDLRASAVVPGFGPVLSNSYAVQDIWS